MKIKVYELDIATRLGMPEHASESAATASGANGHLLEALASQPRPVFDSGTHEAAMDVVEGLIVRPVGLDVVDFELDVRWHPV